MSDTNNVIVPILTDYEHVPGETATLAHLLILIRTAGLTPKAGALLFDGDGPDGYESARAIQWANDHTTREWLEEIDSYFTAPVVERARPDESTANDFSPKTCPTCHQTIIKDATGGPPPSAGDHDPGPHVAKNYGTTFPDGTQP